MDYEEPLFHFFLLGVSLFVWKSFKFKAEAMETEPYAFDGTIPYVFITAGFFEVMFESKCLYKLLYKRKYDRIPYHFEKS